MILFIAILLIALGIISALAAIYCLYCIIGARIFNKKVKNDGKSALDSKSKLNIIVWIIKKSKKVREATDNNLKKIVSKKVTTAIILTLSIIGNLIYSSFFCLSVGVVVYNMDQQITTISTVLQTIFMGDDDCKCYAKCTGDKADDEKCVYELLFGPTEYEKLSEHMIESLPYADIEYFEELNDGTDGKAKSDFIRERINDSMVEDYKAIVGNNSKFRKDDGKDRSKMSFDELKADLYNLLCDYKVNGRNPNCDCGSCALIQLSHKCMGMNHYKEGWSWDAIWDNPSSEDGAGGTSNTPGNATGPFALQLDDGAYYWYHQATHQCKYDAYSESYGYISSCRAGGSTKGNMANRGCGIYSTAMALSNLLGEEVTPWDVITEVMKCTINQAADGSMYFESSSSNGISYSGSVIMSMSTLANLINAKYGSKGVVAEVVSFDQSTIDSYLYSDDMYAYAITSYKSASNFTWYSGDGHFMVLRPGSGSGKYKCFTSASTAYGSGHDNIKKGMNDELSWSVVKSAEKHGECIVIHRDKSYYNTGSGSGGGTVGYNQEVYDILVANSKYSAKALALASVYAALEPEYGKNFAIGMMANIFAEGNFGVIEGIWTSDHKTDTKTTQLTCSCHNGKWSYPYWSKVSADVHAVCEADGVGVTKVNADRVQYLLDNIPDGTSGIGVGIVGWSGGRRVGILKTYQASCTTYSQDELAIAEVLFMKKELQKSYSNGYYYNLVVVPCNGKSASECADIICKNYEAPASGASERNIRAANATELASLLSGVTTSGVTAGGGSSSSSNSDSSSSSNSGSSSSSNSSSSNSGSSSSTSQGQAVVEYAKQFVGNHYKYGGSKLTVSNWKDDPGHLAHVNVSDEEKKKCPLAGADCSGFVMSVYAHFGKSLPHSSSGLRSVGTKVNNPSLSTLKPGDIICYSGHVAIYIGEGKIVHASNHADGIKISNNWDYKSVITVRRIFN